MFRNIAATRRRGLIAAAAATTVLACGIGAAAGAGVHINPFGTSHVGTQADGSVLLPSSQRIAPFGQRTNLTSEAVGHAISPDGTKVAVQAGGVASGARNLNILDAATGEIRQTFGSGYHVARGSSAPTGTVPLLADLGIVGRERKS